MRYLGIDLAWGEDGDQRPANRSGVVALEAGGAVSDAGWTVGVADTVAWIERCGGSDVVLFIDAPLLVENETGQRAAEKQVGQRYGRWWVSANSTNLNSPRLAGVRLRERLEARGWRYDDGRRGPPDTGRVMSECYPYTTIVGAAELGYTEKRPAYKRAAKGVKAAEAWAIRTAACDELIRRIARLAEAPVPVDIRSHEETRALLDSPSPKVAAAYKKREDLLDAVICAWSAALWHQAASRCQLLGVTPDSPPDRPIATIIAPTRPEQRAQ